MRRHWWLAARPAGAGKLRPTGFRLRSLSYAGQVAVASVALAVMAVMASSASADRVVTKSGQTFTGIILEETDQAVVIQTMSGKMTILHDMIARIEREGAVVEVRITPAVVDPLKAAEAFADAQEAIRQNDWVRAGSLLEGLLRLEAAAFPQEDRLTATAALVTCYLQVNDAQGAAGALRQRAALAALETDKKRLVAAAEALEASGKPMIGEAAVGRFEEAMKAGTQWKAHQILDIAKQAGSSATVLNAMDRVDRSALGCLARLGEADLYVPGFSQAHRQEVLASLADNIMDGGRRAVVLCTEERKDLSRFWKTSVYGVKYAVAYNEKASVYLARRQAAEDGLKNLKPFGEKYEVPALFQEREQEVTDLLAKLEDLKYHEKRAGMQERYKIALRQIGGST